MNPNQKQNGGKKQGPAAAVAATPATDVKLPATEQEIAAAINSVSTPEYSVSSTETAPAAVNPDVAQSSGVVVDKTSTPSVQPSLVKQAPAPALIKADADIEVVDLEAWIQKVPSVSSKLLLGQLKTYLVEMKPGLPLDSKQAASQQLQLYRVLNTFLNKVTGDEFTQVWSVVLALFYQEADGVFHDIYVARGFDNVELPPASITAFQNILHLCKVTADYKVRNLALKQLNLEKALQVGVTDQARQSLLSYYNA